MGLPPTDATRSGTNLSFESVTRILLADEAANTAADSKSADSYYSRPNQTKPKPGTGQAKFQRTRRPMTKTGSTTKCASCKKTGCVCYKCNEEGHHANHCKKAQGGSTRLVPHASGLLTTHGTRVPDRWILNTGASHHNVIDRQCFDDYEVLDNCSLSLGAKSATVPIAGRGTATVVTEVDGAPHELRLTGALHVPEGRVNLISVSKVLEKGAGVSFEKGGASMTVRASKVLTAEIENDLFVVRRPTNVQGHSYASMKHNVNLWHDRLGHIGYEALQKTEKLVEGLGLSDDQRARESCKGCEFGKSHRDSFPSFENAEDTPLEFVHMDISGPHSPASPKGARWILVLVDDCSRWVEAIPMSHKSNALSCLKDYRDAMEAQTDRRLRRLRSDNDKVFTSEEAQRWYQQCGIVHEKTVPYTPEQNGVAERYIRTLKNMARSQIQFAKIELQGIDMKHWCSAVRASAYVLNRTYVVDDVTHQQSTSAKHPAAV